MTSLPVWNLQGVVTAGVVYWIHEQNFEERRQMRQGVIKVRV